MMNVMNLDRDVWTRNPDSMTHPFQLTRRSWMSIAIGALLILRGVNAQRDMPVLSDT